jgi:predicted metal-dependent hydrolase
MPAVGSLRLTVPRGATVAGGMAFIEQQVAWIVREDRRQRLLAAPWRDGTMVMWRGEPVPIRFEGAGVYYGDQKFRVGAVGEPASGVLDLRGPVESHQRAVATRELPARCLELAQRHGLSPSAVSVRNQRTRWGSCSSRGRIALNWRLVQTPPFVSDYVVLHELAHLTHQNHSRAFWREVERLCPEWRDAERWIKRRHEPKSRG